MLIRGGAHAKIRDTWLRPARGFVVVVAIISGVMRGTSGALAVGEDSSALRTVDSCFMGPRRLSVLMIIWKRARSDARS
jgi:hypothetical protein